MKGIAALNVYKKVAIIRNPTDTLTYEDVDGKLQRISELGEAVTASTPTLTTAKLKQNIPTPRIVEVDQYEDDVTPTYTIPYSYIRHVEVGDDEVEYNADEEDENWLIGQRESTNSTIFRTATFQSGEKIVLDGFPHLHHALYLSTLEHVLDILEKATGLEAIVTAQQAERLILTKKPGLFYRCGGNKKFFDSLISMIYAYWMKKRSQMKKPLLRQFWPGTATNDTNPHMVFRPREKEKYKLRKKRQNDMDAYRKVRQLRHDFDRIRAMLDLVLKREKLNQAVLIIQSEMFDQRMADTLGSSQFARVSIRFNFRKEFDDTLNIPGHFELPSSVWLASNVTPLSNANKKKKRRSNFGDENQSVSFVGSLMSDSIVAVGHSDACDKGLEKKMGVIAGYNHGNPAPNFLQSLQSRTSFKIDWNRGTPFLPNYMQSHASPTFCFRHRPRIGRGGRIIFDRHPHGRHLTHSPQLSYSAPQSILPTLADTPGGPYDLTNCPSICQLPMSIRVEQICVSALDDDLHHDPDDGNAIIIGMDDWINADMQAWGEERYVTGIL